MIRIIDVCKVLCAACGNYLEGVAAVFDDRVVRLCWQDFEVRAMKRRGASCYAPDPDNGREKTSGLRPYTHECVCHTDGTTDTDSRSVTRQVTGGSETHSWSRGEGRTETQGKTWDSTGCGPRRRAEEERTGGVMRSLDDQLASVRESLLRLKTGRAFVRMEEWGFIDGEGI